ncbi:thiamine phosphate synthase [soil metagenome]
MTAATALRACRLYGIVDLGYVSASSVTRVAREMIAGGVGVIQLRGKDRTVAGLTSLASELHEVTSGGGVPLIVNDHPEIARAVGAEGVHVGQDDISIQEARAAAGPGCLVGKSTHSESQALAAVTEGADYIGFGPVFATPTKPTYSPIGLSEIERVHRAVSVPIFCIGGIKLQNLPEVIAAGAQRVVIVSGLLQASDIADHARAAQGLLNSKSSIENRK